MLAIASDMFTLLGLLDPRTMSLYPATRAGMHTPGAFREMKESTGISRACGRTPCLS